MEGLADVEGTGGDVCLDQADALLRPVEGRVVELEEEVAEDPVGLVALRADGDMVCGLEAEQSLAGPRLRGHQVLCARYREDFRSGWVGLL